MTPTLTETNEFIVVGVRAVMDQGADAFATLWRDKFLPREGELPAVDGYYCVFNPLPHDPKGRYEFVAGKKTDSLEDIPTGMVGWIVPAGLYASAIAEGLAAIPACCDAIITSWLPQSGYKRIASPLFARCSADPAAPRTSWTVEVPIETPETIAQMETWLGSDSI